MPWKSQMENQTQILKGQMQWLFQPYQQAVAPTQFVTFPFSSSAVAAFA